MTTTTEAPDLQLKKKNLREKQWLLLSERIKFYRENCDQAYSTYILKHAIHYSANAYDECSYNISIGRNDANICVFMLRVDFERSRMHFHVT